MSFLLIGIMGLFVAMSSVFLGIGGGILLVPILPSFFDISVHQAVATSVLTIFFVVTNNTVAFHKKGLVEWPVVFLMGPLSAVSAFIAAQFSQRVDPTWILMALCLLLGVVVVRSVMASMLDRDYQVVYPLTQKQKLISGVGGFFAGAASGFAGIGSGAILSPLMIMLKIIAPEKLSPTANANMMFTTAAASLSFLVSGTYVAPFEWGLIQLHIAGGIFVTAFVLGALLRPFQDRVPFRAKSMILNLLLCFLIVKVVLMFLGAS